MGTQWTIGKRLVASFSCVAAITLLLGIFGYYGAYRSDQAIEEIGMVRLPSAESLLTIKEKGNDVKAAQRTLLNLRLDKADRQRQYENVVKSREAYAAAWKIYESLPQTPEEEELWNQFVPAWARWREENNKFFELSRKLDAMDLGDPSALLAKLFEVRGTFWKTINSLTKMIQEKTELAETDTVNTFFVPGSGSWPEEIKTGNTEINAALHEFRPVNASIMASVQKMKEQCARGEQDSALMEFKKEFYPKAMKIIEGMRPIHAKAVEASTLYDQMRRQATEVCRESQARANDLLDKIIRLNSQVAASTSKAATSRARFMKISSMTAMIAGLLFALGLGILISRSISRVLTRLATALGEGSEQVASAAGQVSSASQSLAEGSSEQAASIEETSSSMEQMSSITKQNAGSADAARIKIAEARQIVDKVSRHMGDMGKAIEEITRSSEDTEKIIKTIDEIAFQTNLLALNAAVEAARAGEAGAGFAVVADEVRNLAMRAAEAAKNTSNLIENTIRSIKTGRELTLSTQEAFKENMAIVTKVGALVDEIAAASKEQAQGIEEVNKAVAEMDRVVQENAASAEESASASEELSAQAAEMKRKVSELRSLVSGENMEGRRETKAMAAPVRSRSQNSSARHKGIPPRKTVQAPGSEVVKPEQVIPLDEEIFREF